MINVTGIEMMMPGNARYRSGFREPEKLVEPQHASPIVFHGLGKPSVAIG
jgi:hypothetical protein